MKDKSWTIVVREESTEKEFFNKKNDSFRNSQSILDQSLTQ